MDAEGDDRTDMSLRRERAVIAAQASSEPGDCLLLNSSVHRKDKTMVYILQTLQRLENKFDTLYVSKPSTPGSNVDWGAVQSGTRPPGVNGTLGASNESHVSSDSEVRPGARIGSQSSFPPDVLRTYQHLTVAHKVLLWPSIYLHILNSGIAVASDLQYVLQEGTPWFIHLELHKHPKTLPWDTDMRTYPMPSSTGEMRAGFVGLTPENVRRMSDAYFSTFNILFPILDRQMFLEDILEPVLRNGFADCDPQGCLVLLVLALGQTAIDGVYGSPISITEGNPSGLRGGTAERPPGLNLFNEARRRMGFIMHQCTLENVQIHLLESAYYEACARHMDFWRATVAASTSCQILIKCESIDWSTPRADLIKRAYWACMLSEDMYHLELDLSQTGIHTLEDQVPLPYFHGSESNYGNPSDEKSHFQYHFLAMIALRRLVARIHESIHCSSNATAELSEDYGGPPVHVIKELARQLESWRSLLPRPLQWSDNDKTEFPNMGSASRQGTDSLFSMDQGSVPINHRDNLDIMTAQLRTQFYYARFMIYRPFVYKALHFPELMTEEDQICCALAIQSACLWPLILAPPKNKKRLVPHLFTWTQNFVGILLILRMTTENECLKKICNERVNRKDLEQTTTLMLEWIQDIKQVDGIAEWSWKMLGPLYSRHG
ncbi:hypothetical protein D6D19_01255 [Aureobasidium pullulans]|uniref:Saposin A-type domain-containing protein n=1 Tax=Aureobasidium pullulans TaxID=5580 RepID=A0A4S9AIC2_AURPU|nr:hypothetical protein D6D19_01255 [Aureobasidium pullulans]